MSKIFRIVFFDRRLLSVWNFHDHFDQFFIEKMFCEIRVPNFSELILFAKISADFVDTYFSDKFYQTRTLTINLRWIIVDRWSNYFTIPKFIVTNVGSTFRSDCSFSIAIRLPNEFFCLRFEATETKDKNFVVVNSF